MKFSPRRKHLEYIICFQRPQLYWKFGVSIHDSKLCHADLFELASVEFSLWIETSGAAGVYSRMKRMLHFKLDVMILLQGVFFKVCAALWKARDEIMIYENDSQNEQVKEEK